MINKMPMKVMKRNTVKRNYNYVYTYYSIFFVLLYLAVAAIPCH